MKKSALSERTRRGATVKGLSKVMGVMVMNMEYRRSPSSQRMRQVVGQGEAQVLMNVPGTRYWSVRKWVMRITQRGQVVS